MQQLLSLTKQVRMKLKLDALKTTQTNRHEQTVFDGAHSTPFSPNLDQNFEFSHSGPPVLISTYAKEKWWHVNTSWGNSLNLIWVCAACVLNSCLFQTNFVLVLIHF